MNLEYSNFQRILTTLGFTQEVKYKLKMKDGMIVFDNLFYLTKLPVGYRVGKCWTLENALEFDEWKTYSSDLEAIAWIMKNWVEQRIYFAVMNFVPLGKPVPNCSEGLDD